MKKLTKILALLLALVTVFSMVACTDNEVKDPDDSENDGTNDDVENPGDNNGDTEKPELTEIKIGVLKGATGIGAVKLMADAEAGTTQGKYDITLYETANVSNLNNDILNGTVNIAALPINAGAALYNKSQGKVKLIAANALGVLSIIGKDDLTSVSGLKGKTIHTTGQASTPEYILNFLLTKNGLDPEKDVTVKYYPDGNAALAGLLAGDGYAMLPEPATTAALVKNPELKLNLSVTDEWNKVSDKKLIQGCLVVNTEYAAAHKAELDMFLTEYAETVKYVQDNTSEAADLVVKYGIIAQKPMAEKSLPRCGVVCITGSEMKNDASEMLNVLFTANPASVGGKLPDDGYYYIAD